jgi:hypothetical protein
MFWLLSGHFDHCEKYRTLLYFDVDAVTMEAKQI